MQFMFRREVYLHTRSSGSSNAAVDGHESTAYTVDEDCHSVTGYVPKAHRICYEHHAAANYQTGKFYR